MTSAPLSYRRHVHRTLALGLPLVGGHLAQFAITLTDNMMMGWYSVEGLAALVLAGTLFFVFFICGSGFAWAIMPLVSSADSQGDTMAIRRVTRMGLWISILYALICAPFYWFSAPLLVAMGQQPDLAADAQLYLRIAWFAMAPALCVMVLKSYLAALERTQIVLWMTVLAAVANIFVNWVLIFGNLGAPEMGIAGAAVATVTVNALLIGGLMIYAGRCFPDHALFVRLWRPDLGILGRVMRLGIPISLTSLAEVGLFAVSSVMMGWLGTVPLAAHGITLQVATAAFAVHIGLSNAATVRTGRAFGAGQSENVMRAATVALGMSLVVAVTTICVFLTMPERLVGLFIDPDEPQRGAILAAGVTLLYIAALFQLADAMQVLALGILRGMQDTTVPMIAAGVSYWLVGIPVAYIFGFVLDWGGPGVWSGLVVGLALAALALLWRFRTWAVPRLRAGAGAHDRSHSEAVG